MDCPQSLTIPIIWVGPKKANVRMGQLESSISNSSNTLSTHKKGKNEKLFMSPEIPFGIKRLDRNPKDILEKKALMTAKDIKGESINKRSDIQLNSLTSLVLDLPKLKKNTQRKENHDNLIEPKISSLSRRILEEEIDMKLFYLDQIQQLQVEIKYELNTAHNEEIKAVKIIEILEDEKEKLVKLLGEVKKEKTALSIRCHELQSKFPELFPESLAIGELDISKDIKNGSGGNLVMPQGPCMTFSNLFDLSGQLSDFCCGEYGSKFVLERLKNGVAPEKDYTMKELNLPNSLLDLLENPHSAKVAISLAIINHKGRADILSHIEMNFSEISSNVKGRDFIVNILNSDKLQTYSDKDLVEALSHEILESQLENKMY